MNLDEKTELEYLLLRNYKENGIIGRDYLLTIPFVALEQVEEDKWYIKIDENENSKFKRFIQIDIISKIMMYIEDLAILSESLLLQCNFYDLLDCMDIGKMTGRFFEKINRISDEQIYKIMSYATPNQIKLDDKSIIIYDKHLHSNVKEVKRILREIGDFGSNNHTLYKRFKHAGIPIFNGNISYSTAGFLRDFEFVSMIPFGPNPLSDIVPIPFSKQALDGYHIIIRGLQLILGDIVQNRIICIQRNIDGLIPDRRYDVTALSIEEAKANSMKKIVNDFYAANLGTEIVITPNYNTTIGKEKIACHTSFFSLQ